MTTQPDSRGEDYATYTIPREMRGVAILARAEFVTMAVQYNEVADAIHAGQYDRAAELLAACDEDRAQATERFHALRAAAEPTHTHQIDGAS